MTLEIQLSAIEARVLGTLMEKQLTTPDQYPLTLNSTVTGCNQKSSREPVSNYSSGEVGSCLNELRNRKLVEVEYGSRAERYDQKLSRRLFLDKKEQAVVTIMLLRGAQTAGDLLNRTQRMVEFENSAAVQELLDTMCNKTAPLILRIPRRAGQREDRYAHLLCGEPDLSEPEPQTTTAHSKDDDLVARVEALEEQLARVLQQLGIDN